jgi:hypothetical protein
MSATNYTVETQTDFPAANVGSGSILCGRDLFSIHDHFSL